MPGAQLSDYEVLDTIGKGTYGYCRKVRRLADGKVLVWKELDYGGMTEREKQMLVSEVNILRELRHPNIVKYHDRIIDRSRATIYILMELCEGGDLAGRIRRCRREGTHVAESFLWKMLYQISSALKTCHKRKRGPVLHRDLKPANIFLDKQDNAKLGDFGLARILNDATAYARTFVGTPYYMSPEQIRESAYNETSDIWSLGCLLYELASLRPPFDALTQAGLSKKITAGRFRDLPDVFSLELNSLLRSMLTVQPGRRPTIEQLLAHPRVAPYRPAPKVTKPKVLDVSDGSSASEELGRRLQRREQQVETREAQVQQRERELDQREARLRRQQVKLQAMLDSLGDARLRTPSPRSFALPISPPTPGEVYSSRFSF